MMAIYSSSNLPSRTHIHTHTFTCTYTIDWNKYDLGSLGHAILRRLYHPASCFISIVALAVIGSPFSSSLALTQTHTSLHTLDTLSGSNRASSVQFLVSSTRFTNSNQFALRIGTMYFVMPFLSLSFILFFSPSFHSVQTNTNTHFGHRPICDLIDIKVFILLFDLVLSLFNVS